MRVLGLSLITNQVINTPYRDLKAEVAAEYANKDGAKAPSNAEEKEETTSHEEVLEVGRQAAQEMSSLVAKIVELAGLAL
jgi:purine-nucleoside phosphorylase